MNAFVIAGGNGGIGLQVARQLLAAGHRVIILERDEAKGKAALASFGPARDRAEFLSADLSAHAGVRDAARRITALSDRIDGVLHFTGFSFQRLIPQVNGAAMYYASHLSATYPKLFAGLVCPGLVRTDIFRDAPWFIKAMVTVTGPFMANSVETAANNPTQALLRGEAPTAIYWGKATDFNDQTPVTADPVIRPAVIDASHDAAGV